MSAMGQTLQQAWLRRGMAARLLWPLAQLFGLLAALRRRLYRAGLFASTRMPVPVMVVGNVVAGGAGKTPVVLALLDHLRQRGLRAGVVSRGYGRASSGCREVQPEDEAHAVGDEPLLIRRKAGVPVVVAASRVQAAQALLAAHPATQVIVCDDGLQHLALARDIEICVFDERGTGNGWLLPAGPLRETWPRPADLVLRPQAVAAAIAGFGLRRTLADHAQRADGTRIALASLRGQPCTALAGIASPLAFFAMLREQGLQLHEALSLPDHYDFESTPGPKDGAYSLICTEKDAVKLWRLRPDAWAVPLVLEIAPDFWQQLDVLLDAKLSSGP
ncbi:tetraacyldisaccharide 4'-kinase [uncultured Ramlibacter sp.]|uniref:tetraacyldisaccharide 4'-kinase n=1 Tax=uncultured Ramlibacter sp. TaxID=260755 RepID=UPI0026219738|nr:tetraacyldisaccharide 4'-kinase [uncultured Ramlibacter sp.]